MRDVLEPWGDRIRRIPLPVVESLGLAGLLVRPDGIVAWACDRDPDRRELESAATRWFGAPG
jgi:hypothetical protein